MSIQQKIMTFDELLTLIRSENGPCIRTDSRLVKDGDIFVAVKGTQVDGHNYISKAIGLGADVIVCESVPEEILDKIIAITNTPVYLALIGHSYGGWAAAQVSNKFFNSLKLIFLCFLKRKCPDPPSLERCANRNVHQTTDTARRPSW